MRERVLVRPALAADARTSAEARNGSVQAPARDRPDGTIESSILGLDPPGDAPSGVLDRRSHQNDRIGSGSTRRTVLAPELEDELSVDDLAGLLEAELFVHA